MKKIQFAISIAKEKMFGVKKKQEINKISTEEDSSNEYVVVISNKLFPRFMSIARNTI